ncbi:MAG: hypothetical protein IPK70_04555 [Flavobacteriales bacterium]|nr:hypothetical protein [Flavobacteriales bacterium]
MLRKACSAALAVLLPLLVHAQPKEDAACRSVLLSANATDEERMSCYKHMGPDAFDHWSASLPTEPTTCELLHRIAGAFHDADPAISLRIAERALDMADRSHVDPRSRAVLEQDVAYACQALEHYARALRHFRSAAVLYEQAGDTTNAAECLFYTGDILTDLGDTTRALACMRNYVELSDRNGLAADRVEALRALARTLHHFGRTDSALALLVTSYRLAEQAQDTTEMGLSLLDAGETHRANGDLALAEDELRLSITMLNHGARRLFQHLAYQCLASVFAERGSIPEAISAQNRVLALAQASSLQRPEAEAHIELATLLDRTGQGAQALQHARLGLDVATTAGLLKLRVRALQQLVDLHRAAKRYAVAITYQDSLRASEDSLRHAQGKAEAASESARSEYEKALAVEQAQSAQQLEQERATTHARELEHRMQRISLVVMIGFVVLFAGVLFVRLRINRRMQLEEVRTRLSRDLHDDIGSTLSSINILTSVARRKAEAGDVEGAAASLTGISERSQRLQRNMSDIVWSVDPDRDSLEELLVRMREFGASVLEPKEITYRFDAQGDHSTALQPMVKSNLYLIFKEAVNNAAKHAQATVVNVAINYRNNRLKMTIADNGSGLPDTNGPSRAHGGNGLRNMRTRAEEMNAELNMDSTPEKGTTIDLTIPL